MSHFFPLFGSAILAGLLLCQDVDAVETVPQLALDALTMPEEESNGDLQAASNL